MDVNQELAEEILEYACSLGYEPVVFWLLHKYFNTDQLINHLSGNCKKRVTCQLLYWTIKDSKVELFNHCLKILHELKEDHFEVCSQTDWVKLELGIKLKIVLQQMLNGSSQSQCLETFYEQFPDFEEDKTESSKSEEHMLQLLFQLIKQPSLAATNDNFQDEVSSKLIHAIRHRAKHLVVNLNRRLPDPQVEKAALGIRKKGKNFEKFPEEKRKFCAFLQRRPKPTCQQLLQYLKGNNRNKIDYDQKVEIAERILNIMPETSSKGYVGERIHQDATIREERNSKKVSLFDQASAEKSKLLGRNNLRSNTDEMAPSVTRLRSSALISKRGTGDVNTSGNKSLTASDNVVYNEGRLNSNLRLNWPLGLHGENVEKDVDFVAKFREESDHLRHQIDEVEKLLNACKNSKCVVELKRFKSVKSFSLYGQHKDKHVSLLLRNDHLATENSLQNHEKCFEKEISPDIIILSDSDESSQRVSSKLRQRKRKKFDGGPVNVDQGVRVRDSLSSQKDSSINSSEVARKLRQSKRNHVAETLSSHSGSTVNSSKSNSGLSRRPENSNHWRQSRTENFTDCRENFESEQDVFRREGLHLGRDSEVQKVNSQGENDVDISPVDKGGSRKRKSDEKSLEEKEAIALTSDSDNKESSEEVMIVVGSNCSQSLGRKVCKEEEHLKNCRDEGNKRKLIHSRRKMSRVGTWDVEIASKDLSLSGPGKDVEISENANKQSCLLYMSHQQNQSLKSSDMSSIMESATVSRGFHRENSGNIDSHKRSPLSSDKALLKTLGNVDKKLVNASPVFEYKHSSGSSSDKSISLLTGKRILFTADDELIPNFSVEGIAEVSQENVSCYPIDLSELATFPVEKKKCSANENDQQVRLTNSSNSHNSYGSEVHSDQARVISETPPDSPDGNLNDASPLMMQKSDEYPSDSSSFQNAQRQQTHSFSKSSSDDIQHVSDSEDEEDVSSHQKSQNHPRFPSLVQYLKDDLAEKSVRTCSIVLHKIKLDKLRLRVLLSQESQEIVNADRLLTS